MSMMPKQAEPSLSSARLRYMRPDEVVASWNEIAEQLAKPLEQSSGRFSEATIMEAAQKYHMQIWLIGDDEEWLGVAVTQINRYSTGLKAMEILMAAGREMNRWRDVIYQLEDSARGANCSFIEANGRRGWGKNLPEGWKEESVFFQKDLR